MGRNLRAKSYRLCAVEIRAIADTFQNPEHKERMLRMADNYDRMANQIEKLDVSDNLPNPTPGI